MRVRLKDKENDEGALSKNVFTNEKLAGARQGGSDCRLVVAAFHGGRWMAVQDEQRPVIYGSPPRLPYREEIQSIIGEELRARYTVPQELPFRELSPNLGDGRDQAAAA
jgi:hypothetical protein